MKEQTRGTERRREEKKGLAGHFVVERDTPCVAKESATMANSAPISMKECLL